MEECEDAFSFRHALVRDAVEEQLLGRERRRLHDMALQRAARVAVRGPRRAGPPRRAAPGATTSSSPWPARACVHYLAGGSSHQALRLAVDALAEAPDDIVLLDGGGPGRVAARPLRRGAGPRRALAPRGARAGRPGRAGGGGAPAGPALPRDRPRRRAVARSSPRSRRSSTSCRRARTGPAPWRGWPSSTCCASAPEEAVALGRAGHRRGRRRRRQGRAGPGPGGAGLGHGRPAGPLRRGRHGPARGASPRPRRSATGCSSPGRSTTW